MDNSTKKKCLRWTKKNPPYQIGEDDFAMLHIKKDPDGWVDEKIYHPLPYDMVLMKTTDKKIPGWWTGQKWEGVRLEDEDKVLWWKLGYIWKNE